jgi:hypothetical protein
VEQAFGYVLFAVVIVAALVAVLTFAGARRSYGDIGKGGLFVDDKPAPRPPPAALAAERDDEIRQMLAARNARRAAKGQAPLDVDAELRRLTAPAAGAGPGATADPGLRAEVRALVEAQNRRRIRKGEEPLDVEAEVDRQLREL